MEIDSKILDNIDLGSEFSFTNTAGTMIVNHEFEKGFIDFSAGKNTERAYIWEVLSAVSDSIGQTIYDNVENYIDLASNVETCKVDSLRSLMKMLGMQYDIFNEYDVIPLEINRVMSLFSIDRKHFMNDGKVKDAILSSMIRNGVLQGEISVEGNFTTAGTYYGNGLNFDEETYHEYLSSLYHTLIIDVLTQKYGLSGDYVFKDAVYDIEQQYSIDMPSDSSHGDQYEIYNRKIQYGLDHTFKQETIFQNIEDGYDSYDNYSGYELSLLVFMRDSRKGVKIYGDEDKLKYHYPYESITRYSYYNKKKVRDYIEFLTNKYYIITLSSGYDDMNYEYNNNYFQVRGRDKVTVFTNTDVDGSWTKEQVVQSCINNELVETVVRNLVYTTEYIRTLRDKIKLQCRKNYMKGTNNLLVYLINEYLMQYFRQNSDLSIKVNENALEYGSFLKDIDIVEYDDKTEYSNIATDLDYYSISSGTTCNDRFWQDRMDDDGLNFTLAQIQEFYLSTMNMKYGTVLSDEYDKHDFLTGFLDAIYSCGASTQSFNKNGFVNTQIERDGEYTQELYQRLVTLSTNYEEYDENIDHEEYSYPEDILSNQISDVIQNYIYPKLSSEYLSAISDVYDEFSGEITDISAELTGIGQQYEDILSGDYSFYFNKPSEDDYPYSYEDGQYKHPTSYYVSSQYDVGLKYVYDKLLRLQSFVQQQDNIRNYPIIDAVEVISGQLYSISSTLMDNVIHKIEPYGFVDISSPDMSKEMEEADSFLDTKITERYTIIQSNIDSIRDSANQLLSRYNTLYSNATNLLANYYSGDLSNAYISFGVGACQTSEFDYGEGVIRGAKSGKDKIDKYHDWVLNHNDEYYYANALEGEYSKKTFHEKGKFHVMKNGVLTDRVSESDNESLSEILSEETPLTTILSKFKEYLDQTTSIKITKQQYEYEEEEKTKTGYQCILEPVTAKNNAGTMASLNSIQQQLDDLTEQFNSINGSYRRMIGEVEYSSEADDLKKQIIELLEGVSDEKFPETVYAKDTMIQTYREYKAVIVQISAQYTIIEDRYQVIYEDSKQVSYLSDARNISDLQFKCLDNLQKYVKTTDAKNKETLKTQIQTAIDAYTQLVYDTIDLISRISKRETIPATYKYTGSVLEVELEQIRIFLENDVKNKYDRGLSYIQLRIYEIQTRLNAVKSEITAYLNTDTNFDSAVSSRLSDLNFFENDVYKQHEKLFLTYYGGTYSYYPYYNFRNVEHPSYQIHPFMWNLIEHGSVMEDIQIAVYNAFIDDFEPEYIQSRIYEYIGDLGQSINEWKNGVFDFTGYTTGYENSKHLGETTITSQVVDYDGSFYPKAIEDMRNNTQQSISCLGFYLDKHMRPVSYNIAYNSAKMIISAMGGECNGYTVSSIIDSTITPYVGMNCEISDAVTSFFTVSSDMNSGIRTDIGLAYVRNSLCSTMYPSFFEKYYNHLNVTDGDINFEIRQICSYIGDIFEITKNKPLSSQQDIYQYGKDIYDNHYILFKTYSSENPTYKEKQNALGELWIRRKDHPFAFPAFYGENPNVEMLDKTNCLPSVYRMEQTYEVSALRPITEGRVCRFFDFRFSENKQNLILYAQQTDKGYVNNDEVCCTFNVSCEYEQFNLLENCAIIFGYVKQQKLRKLDNKTVLTLYDSDSYSSYADEYIFSVSGDTEERPQTYLPISSYSYTGTFTNGLQDTFFVYVLKEHDLSGNSKILEMGPQVRIIRHENQNIVNVIDSEKDIITKPYDGQVCISYHNNKITFAYIKEYTETDTGTCEGRTLYDPSGLDMNSNDILEQSICFVDTVIKSGKLKTTGVDSSVEANINADMSYYPVYSSSKLSNATVLDNNALGTKKLNVDYASVQLMGKDKNLDEYTKIVNTDTNPYYNYEQLKSNYEFGRVYEDYDSNVDTNITSYSNPSLRYQEDNNGIVWSIGPFNVDAANIGTYQLLFQNDNTSGKYPYFVGTCKDICSEYVVCQNYDGEFQDEQIIGNEYFHTQTMIGMDPYDRTNYKSNHLRGIKSIEMKMVDTQEGYKIHVHMTPDNKIPNEYLHVRNGILHVTVFNPSDMRYLEKFHMLDTYGIMRAYDITKDQAHRYVVNTDAWTIVTETPESDIDYQKRALKSYFINKFGFKEFLEDIQISDYSSIEDMWIYSADKNLQFKEEDGVFFDYGDKRYYYPSINKKYPITVSEKYQERSDIYKNNGLLIDKVYDNTNVYILSCLDEKEIADNIGTVVIEDSTYDCETYRVYEDYLLTSTYGTLSIRNYDKFDPDDGANIEFISCYLHSYETNTISSIISCGDDMDVFMSKNVGKCGESYVKSITSQMTIISVDSSNADISKFTNIFVSYQKTSDLDIDLYFNYFNYLDTRFIRIGDDGNEYYDTIKNTYLKLKNGEDGILDIVVQIKNFNEIGDLVGLKNITLASYHMYNVSDDKPKFVMNQVYKIAKDDHTTKIEERYLIRIGSTYLDISNTETDSDGCIEFDIPVYIEQNTDVDSIEFQIQVPSQIITVKDYTGEYFKSSCSDGLVTINTKQKTSSFSIKGKTTKTKEELTSYVGIRYGIPITYVKGLQNVQTVDGSFVIQSEETETALVDFTQTALSAPSFVGLRDDLSAQYHEIYRVT